MKAKNVFKALLAITGLLLTFSAQAQDVPPITPHVETAGTLPQFGTGTACVEVKSKAPALHDAGIQGRSADATPNMGKEILMSLKV